MKTSHQILMTKRKSGQQNSEPYVKGGCLRLLLSVIIIQTCLLYLRIVQFREVGVSLNSPLLGQRLHRVIGIFFVNSFPKEYLNLQTDVMNADSSDIGVDSINSRKSFKQKKKNDKYTCCFDYIENFEEYLNNYGD